MVIDTSALVAILRNEPERRAFTEALEEAETKLLSTANFVESSILLEARYGPDALRDLDLIISKGGIDLITVDADQAYLARQGFSEYGKGRHPAGLNFGDCFAYALAKIRNETLLYKGDDFAHTDVEPYGHPTI